MGTIFLNSRTTKMCDLCRVLINLSDKINLQRSDKYVGYDTLISTLHRKM